MYLYEIQLNSMKKNNNAKKKQKFWFKVLKKRKF